MKATGEKGNKRPTIGRLLSTGGGLLAFGLVFDQVTNQVNKRYEQRSSLLVVIGVAVTVIARQRLPIGPLYDFFSFSCSGLPMIAGQFIRYSIRRNRARQHERDLR